MINILFFIKISNKKYKLLFSMKKKIENKRQKFVRLAELRTEKAVLAIENLIGLSNPRNYDFNAKDVNLIIKALTDSVNAVSSSFSKSKEKKQFKIS